MGGILLSRLLGFFREWTVAHQVGSNAMTDAYYAAFTLPDFLNYLVAGASLSVTFIPVFTKYAAEGREEEGWRVFSTVITFMGLLLTGLVIAGEIFAPHLANAISPGLRPRGEGPRHFPHPPDAARAILLLPGQHPQRRAICQGPIRNSLSRARGLQRL